MVVASSGAQGRRAGDQFLRIGDIGRGDLVHHVGGRVAQHALGADVEDLNDAFLVGGDTREVGAVENRVLQGPRFQQSLFAADLGDDIHRAGGILGGGRYRQSNSHMVLPCTRDANPTLVGHALACPLIVFVMRAPFTATHAGDRTRS